MCNRKFWLWPFFFFFVNGWNSQFPPGAIKAPELNDCSEGKRGWGRPCCFWPEWPTPTSHSLETTWWYKRSQHPAWHLSGHVIIQKSFSDVASVSFQNNYTLTVLQLLFQYTGPLQGFLEINRTAFSCGCVFNVVADTGACFSYKLDHRCVDDVYKSDLKVSLVCLALTFSTLS